MINLFRQHPYAAATIAVAGILLLWFTTGFYGNRLTIVLPLNQAYGLNDVRDYSADSHGARFTLTGRDAYLSLPLPQRIESQKLRLKLNTRPRVHTVRVFFGLRGQEYSVQNSQRLPVHRLIELVFDIALPAGHYESLRIKFEPELAADGKIATSKVDIDSLSIVPLSAADNPLFVFLLAALIAAGMILPGTLIYALVRSDKTPTVNFALTFFALSICFYFVLYLLMAAGQALALPYLGKLLLLAFFGSLTVFAVLARRCGRLGDIRYLLAQIKPELILFGLLVLLCTHIITYDLDLPFQNLHYKSISGPKTFGATSSHDNYFQFVNGKAIAENEPFSKYYHGGRLFYQPQHRTMLPGVIYSVFRKGITALSDYTGRSYLTYTLLGLVCNLMVLFPLAVIARRYFTIPAVVILTALSINAFVLVNYWITWYKFAGGALILAGIAALLSDRQRTSQWLLAGALLGVGANMHSGNVLAVPMLFLLFLYWHLRRQSGLSYRSLYAPLALVLAFVVINLPWAVIKEMFFDNKNVLLYTFFFGGKMHRDGILATIPLFLDAYPLSEQLQFRVNNFINAFHFRDISGLSKALMAGRFDYFFVRWNQIEFSRIAFDIYPPLLFLAGNALLNRIQNSPRPPASTLAVERNQVLAAAVTTVFLIIVTAYASFPPDNNSAQPMGNTLLILTLLTGLVFQSRRAIVVLYCGYLLIVAARMAPFL